MIEKTLVHESYNPRITVYDISLLKTRTQIKFGPKVGPACLPTGPMNLQGQYVKGVGKKNIIYFTDREIRFSLKYFRAIAPEQFLFDSRHTLLLQYYENFRHLI